MNLKHSFRLLGALVAVVASMAAFAGAAQAATPAPGYERFAGCPTTAEAPTTELCLRTVITGGHFQMGNKDVPITNPIVITGGTDGSLGNFHANAQGGMKPAKQKVPGGVVGLTGLTWLLEILGSEALTLYAVTEAMGPPVFGPTIDLPIRVHLVNSVLGNNCYVGSPSNPISLHLTYGTTSPPPPNLPIKGTVPTNSFDEATEVVTQTGGVAVDNSFSAPGANGCVLTLFGFIPISINGLVNTQSGLPAAAGTNETTQKLDNELTPVSRVYP